MQSIQNHAWHRCHDFGRCHLKLLCCSIQIRADALSLDRRPFLGQDLDLLLCTGFDLELAVLFLYHISTQRPINDKRLSKEMNVVLVSNNFSLIRNFQFKRKKWVTRCCPKLKTCWILNWVSIARVASCFPQASQQLLTATASNLEKPCVWSCPSDPCKQSWRAAPRAWQLILPSDALNLRSPSGTAFGEITRWQAGA